MNKNSFPSTKAALQPLYLYTQQPAKHGY